MHYPLTISPFTILTKMNAVSYKKYGSPEVIEIVEKEIPIPKENEILIKIRQTVLTPSDCVSRQGTPYIVRLFEGLLRPKKTPGTDFVGEVKEVGNAVKHFKAGDQVFGSTGIKSGTHAEYALVAANGAITLKPENIADEETAGMCDAAMTALTFLRDEAKIEKGQKVLINGASGAIGTFAIQLAKYFGSEVTAVCSGKNAAFVTDLGADNVIDYTQEDFTLKKAEWDIIFDVVGKSSYSACKDSLAQEGKYLTTVPSFGIIAAMAKTALFGKKKAIFAATGLNQTKKKLDFLKSLIEEEKLKSVIDRTYSLEEMAEAHRYVETGRKTGNVIIQVS